MVFVMFSSSRDHGFMRDDVVPIVHFVLKPVLQLQHGIFVLTLGDGDVLHGSIYPEFAPADGNARFHRHTQPELASGCEGAFLRYARILRERAESRDRFGPLGYIDPDVG